MEGKVRERQSGLEHPSANELALVRTVSAQDRTLTAWMWTAFSMTGFGFTILEHFQCLGESKVLDTSRAMSGPANPGATLIMAGTASLVMAAIQRWRLIAAGGLVAFTSALIRTGIS
jgi:putative membrane protein